MKSLGGGGWYGGGGSGGEHGEKRLASFQYK